MARRGERIAFVMAVSRDESVANMGHPALFCFVNTVEGYEEEVDGEGHPEGEEDVGDVEARVEVGADAGG